MRRIEGYTVHGPAWSMEKLCWLYQVVSPDRQAAIIYRSFEPETEENAVQRIFPMAKEALLKHKELCSNLAAVIKGEA